jgi:DnaJ-class molecular chaperone
MQEVQDVTTRAPRPTTSADLHRLAALAQTRGLRLTQESATVWFCSSSRQHSDPHYVTGLSCDCRGFQEHQRCTHQALLLAHLGWLPEVDDPPAPATVSCPNCSGGGVVYVHDCERAGWPYPDCPDCHGTGEIPVAAPLAA